MEYNKIDLAKYRTEAVDSIFTNKGVFLDGRPYIEECWSGCGCTMLTVFMPSNGFDVYDQWEPYLHLKKAPEDLRGYLEKQGYDLSNGAEIECFGADTDRLLSINKQVGIDD